MFDLTGRVALVTGAGQGVGAGIARLLAIQGASVAVNDLRGDRAEKTVRAITDAGCTARAFAFDVTERDAVTEAVAEVESSLGPVDILVNNAGNGGAEQLTPKQFRETTPEEWRGAIDVNLFGVMACSRAVINGMSDRGWGRVITIASDAGRIGVTLGVSAYGAGKGGAIGFMRHLAIESARSGVTANTVALGLMSNVNADRNAAAIRSIPVGRTGTPEDVGAICVYLASDEAAWITGQLISINGGQSTF